jgi:hypothetical protein
LQCLDQVTWKPDVVYQQGRLRCCRYRNVHHCTHLIPDCTYLGMVSYAAHLIRFVPDVCPQAYSQSPNTKHKSHDCPSSINHARPTM